MSDTFSTTAVANRVQQLLDERQQHEDAILKINKTLADISALLGTGPAAKASPKAAAKSATKATATAAPSPSPAKGRRKRQKFAVTGEQFILAFVKEKRNPTTKQINAHWTQAGRGGPAASLLSNMVKNKKLKRKSLGGKLGSEFSLP